MAVAFMIFEFVGYVFVAGGGPSGCRVTIWNVSAPWGGGRSACPELVDGGGRRSAATPDKRRLHISVRISVVLDILTSQFASLTL